MRKSLLFTLTAAVACAALAGCVAYPAYQQPIYQQPIARLTPSESAALASRPIDPAERDRLAKLDAQVQREDQADIDAQRQAYTYVAPAPYYYNYPYYDYPYYGGFYPWVPGLSLSFGYAYHRGWGGYHRGWGGRGWGGRGWGGRGWHGGGGHWHR